MNHFAYLIQAVFCINVLVLLHELGHLAMAKLFGVNVSRFSVGMGPRIFGLRFRGTEYRLAAFPVGGYVQMSQTHREGDQEGHCLECISAWKRVLIYFAGPFANLVVVLTIFWFLFSIIQYEDRAPIVSAVVAGSPAGESGIMAGDRIVEINGRAVHSWSDILRAWKSHSEEPLSVTLERTSSPLQKPPDADLRTVSLTSKGSLGIVPTGTEVLARLSPWVALQKAWERVRFVTALVFDSLQGLVTAKIPPSQLVGPMYLFHITSEAAAKGFITLLYFMAFISANLFLFNLIPLPVLDGGQIMLACVQKLLRRPLATRSMKLLTNASVVWLLLILVSATFNDVIRLIIS